jgi:tetratricopeptide (TPR) repeat protein
LGNLSGVLRDMGDYKSAKDGYQKALEILRNISEKTTFNMPMFGESLRSFEDMGDYKSAKDGYQKALEI